MATTTAYEVLIRAKIHVPDDAEVQNNVEQTILEELDGSDFTETAEDDEEFDFTLDVQSVRIIPLGATVAVDRVVSM